MMDGQRVVVLGGGVIGVATAWYLARNGCEVTLVERREAAALETSFANAGLITPGMSDPWNAPDTPLLILKSLGQENSPFLLRLSAIPGLLSWGLQFLRQCNTASWRRNTHTILRLCTFSHECLRALAQETGIDYESNPRGTLRLIRDRPAMEKSVRTADMLRDLGVRSCTLDTAGVIELEPALAGQVDSIVGGIHYPDDEAGDAHLFSQRLAQLCASQGVEFLYNEPVERIEVQDAAFSGVRTRSGRIDADACVVALGNGSVARLRPLGIRLPIYPVKGYSLTFPVGDWDGAPVVPMSDDGYHVGMSRIGDRVRVAGSAELAGLRHHPDRGTHSAPANLLPHPLSRLPGQGAGWRLDRVAADDAGRQPLSRFNAGQGPVRQHRPRPPRLDDGLRVGEPCCRPRLRPRPGNRSERPDPGEPLIRPG